MSSKIQIFILSLKNSDRIDRLKKRLKILNIKYKILLGINGNNKINHKHTVTTGFPQHLQNELGSAGLIRTLSMS